MTSNRFVRKPSLVVLPLVLGAALGAAYSDYVSAKQKFDQIESDRLRPGSRVELTTAELNAWVEQQLPAGVRNPRLRVLAPGIASGSALVDFNKLRRAQGQEPGWLVARLLDGEHSVSVTARIRSANRQATVEVERVEIGGIAIEGGTLDFLVQNVLLPMYPNAAVNRPFELGHRIDKLDVRPEAVSVWIGK